MARGRKPALSLEEQLAKITSDIEGMEQSLKEMKEAKSEIEEKIRMNRIAELDNLIAEKGMTFEQVKELLSTKE